MTSDAAAAKTAKGERTRARLIEIAIRRFGESGHRAVSVSQIAREAGLTPAATYAYFPDKDALFREAVRADLDALMASAVPGSSADVPDSNRPMAALFGNLLVHLPRHPLVATVMRDGTAEQVADMMGADGIQRLTDALERGIRDRQAIGHAAGLDPHDLAVGVETLVMSLLTSVVRTGVTPDPDRARGVVAVFDAAFGGAPTDVERAQARSGLLRGDPPPT